MKYTVKNIVLNVWFARNILIRNKQLYGLIMLHKELKDKVTFGVPVKRRIDYNKDVVVVVCPSCHAKLHRNPLHPLYPKNKNSDSMWSK